MPVIVGAGESVQWGGDEVVERVEGPGPTQGTLVEQTGKALELGKGCGFQCGEKVSRVNRVEAAGEVVPAGGQSKRSADGRRRFDNCLGRCFLFAEPFEQSVTAERKTYGLKRTRGQPGFEAPENPVNFDAVTGVVGPRQSVGLA